MRPVTRTVLRKWRSLGIRQRLVIALMLPLVAIFLVSAMLEYRLARNTADTAFDHGLADTIYDLETHIRKQLPTHRYDLAEETEAMLRSSAPDRVYFSIRDIQGTLLAGDPGLPSIVLEHTQGISFHDARFREQPVRMAVLWVTLPNTTINVTVLETTMRRQQSSRDILAAMLLQNMAVLSVILLVVFLGIRQGLSPLGELEREISERSADDLREIELKSAPAEIRQLLQKLNQLFAMLREAADVQQRFIGDAAHQLRTPLAGLQNQLDLAVSEGLFREHPERLSLIQEGTGRMGHLLTQLLSYAKAEKPGAGIGAPESVALDQIVEKSASEFIDAAIAKNIDLGFEIRPARTFGHAWLLQEALANLIDNAIRYTPKDGVITVRCGEEEGRSYLEVEDDGPGIPDEFRPHILERFYRVPGAPGNGCGLGLSIVSEIAKLHKGAVEFSSGTTSGLRVRMVLPKAG